MKEGMAFGWKNGWKNLGGTYPDNMTFLELAILIAEGGRYGYRDRHKSEGVDDSLALVS